MKAKDAVGLTFNRLTLLHITEVKGKGRTHGMFRCSCGSETSREVSAVVCGRVKSCGCAMIESTIKMGHANKVHGLTGSKEHYAWGHMIQRCYNPNNKSYHAYGGRGIRVCARWLESFANFLVDMGHAPHKSMSVERINVDGNYEPSNCKWATPKEQGRNQRKTRRDDKGRCLLDLIESGEVAINPNTLASRLDRGMSVSEAVSRPTRKISRTLRNQKIAFNGQEMTISEWAAHLGMPMKTLSFRLVRWPVDRALTQPLRKGKSNA